VFSASSSSNNRDPHSTRFTLISMKMLLNVLLIYLDSNYDMINNKTYSLGCLGNSVTASSTYT